MSAFAVELPSNLATVLGASVTLEARANGMVENCSGMMVAPQVLLTATHCFADDSERTLRLYEGKVGALGSDLGSVSRADFIHARGDLVFVKTKVRTSAEVTSKVFLSLGAPERVFVSGKIASVFNIPFILPCEIDQPNRVDRQFRENAGGMVFSSSTCSGQVGLSGGPAFEPSYSGRVKVFGVFSYFPVRQQGTYFSSLFNLPAADRALVEALGVKFE